MAKNVINPVTPLFKERCSPKRNNINSSLFVLKSGVSRSNGVKKIKRVLSVKLQKRLPTNIKVIGVFPEESRRLNRLYRKKNKPTNVLSFRYGSKYGEIILCPSVIRSESKKAGNTYRYQLTWMILHGMLHLGGLHHERSERMRKKVEKLERHLLEKMIKTYPKPKHLTSKD